MLRKKPKSKSKIPKPPKPPAPKYEPPKPPAPKPPKPKAQARQERLIKSLKIPMEKMIAPSKDKPKAKKIKNKNKY